MQPNARCHKCPILPLYRLTNLSTDSPNTLTSFKWLQAHTYSLTFTLWFVHDVHIRLTITVFCSCVSLGICDLPHNAHCVSGPRLRACVPLTPCAISWPPKLKRMFFSYIYINIKPEHARIRLKRCVQIPTPSVKHFRRFAGTRAHAHKRANYNYTDRATASCRRC
jgi:hypothetical protein